MLNRKAFSAICVFPGNGMVGSLEPVRVDPSMGGYAPVQDWYLASGQVNKVPSLRFNIGLK